MMTVTMGKISRETAPLPPTHLPSHIHCTSLILFSLFSLVVDGVGYWLLLIGLIKYDDNMAEEQAAEGMNIVLPPDNNNMFVYTGEQDVPAGVTHVIIDRSVRIIPREALRNRRNLVSVVCHYDVEKIEARAFFGCSSLRGIKLPGVREVGFAAFWNCTALADVEFGDKLETIGSHAFSCCCSLRNIKIPTVRTIRSSAFQFCKQLTDMELPAVEEIGFFAFLRCGSLRRIAIPPKDNILPFDAIYQRYNQFEDCENLTTVDLVGEVHNTISSLLLESWRNEMNQEIDRINQELPNTPAYEKTVEIQEWIRSVINRMEHHKAEHHALLKEDMTQLELALWKAKLDDNEDDNSNLKVQTKKDKIDVESMRKERRIKSGAAIVIKNVLPFLKLE